VTLLRRHDRYVLKAFWGSFGAVMLFFTVISVVLDLAERVRGLVRNWDELAALGHEPWLLLGRFYGTLIPFVWMRLVPVAAAMGAAFALARLARHNELAPLVTSGVSTRRLLLPIVASGALLAALLMAARETVVAPLNHEHLALHRLLTKRSPDRMTAVPHFHDPGGGRLSMNAYMPIGRRMEEAILTFRRGDGDVRVDLYAYPELAWSAERGRWVAPRGGYRSPLDPQDPSVLRYPLEPGSVAAIDASPSLIEISLDQGSSLGLSFAESAALLRANPNSARLVLSHHEQFTLPLSTVVLLLLTLPLCVNLQRKGALPGMVGAMGFGALFFAVGRICGSIAGTGDVNPVVMAWLPVAVFGSLGLALYASMRS
jgi:lipopolysaccharide export system permease protein